MTIDDDKIDAIPEQELTSNEDNIFDNDYYDPVDDDDELINLQKLLRTMRRSKRQPNMFKPTNGFRAMPMNGGYYIRHSDGNFTYDCEVGVKALDQSLQMIYARCIALHDLYSDTYVGLGQHNTKSKIAHLIPEYYSTRNGRKTDLLKMENMNTSTQSTTYVRATNDYTLSPYQIFSRVSGVEPNNTNVVNVANAPYTEAPMLLASISEFASSVGYSVVQELQSNYFDDLVKPDDARDAYCVYSQHMTTYKNGDDYFTVEILGSLKMICVTVMSNTQIDTIVEFVVNSREKYKTYVEEIKDKTFYTISAGQHGFELEDLDIKIAHTDEIIQSNYNDDFSKADLKIKTCIDDDNKGLILLHGIPGSGKTSYIKHLITRKSHRKIVYIPPHLATSIASPNFISFVKNELSNSVLVIEDAEQILISRESTDSHKEAVANILNMTDGILADALNIMIICTFNVEMQYIDNALKRKGRMLLEYRFNELTADKTEALTQQLYGKSANGKSMPLSDIFNLDFEQIRPAEVVKPAFGFGKRY